MEKRNPTFDLEALQAAFSDANTLNRTTTAKRSATALGFNANDIVAIIQSIRRDHFYKSMTSHANHDMWQDVYFVPSSAGVLYVKFTMSKDGFLLLSFKEKDNDE